MRPEFKLLTYCVNSICPSYVKWMKYLLIGFTIGLVSKYEFLHRILGSDPDSVKLFTNAEFQEYK